jgi:hypothetical protein
VENVFVLLLDGPAKPTWSQLDSVPGRGKLLHCHMFITPFIFLPLFQYALEGWAPNTYLGYSVEPSCLSKPFVPHDKRDDHAYVMTKRLAFMEENSRVWPPHFYEAASNATGIQFVIGAKEDSAHAILPPSLKNLGYLSQPAFLDTLSKSRVLVGVGRPLTCVNSSQQQQVFDGSTLFLFL